MTPAEPLAPHPAGPVDFRAAHEELEGSDPHLYRLNVEFVHAHGIPKGQIIAFCTRVAIAAGTSGN
jgi:hypothetical protein